MDHVAVKLEQDLAPMDEGNGEKQVKLRSMNICLIVIVIIRLCERAMDEGPPSHIYLIVIIRLCERAILVRLHREVASSGTR